jgi:acetyltransferase-like isoleucine patch superfamily enzyme
MRGINLLRSYKLEMNQFIWTKVNRFIAKYLIGVNLGKKCTFQGKTIFFKTRYSNIQIGNKCRFISIADGSNLIGINRPCIINTQTSKAKIYIGEGCGFSGTVIGASMLIQIGHNVKCGANTLITDSDWHPEDVRSGTPAPVIIGDNVWLGVNTVVLKGVTIGMNSIIGANSLVTKDIPENVVAGGNPCGVIKNTYKYG